MPKTNYKDEQTPLGKLSERINEITDEYFAERMDDIMLSIKRRCGMVLQGDQDRVDAVCMEVAKDCNLLGLEMTYPTWLPYLVKGFGNLP